MELIEKLEKAEASDWRLDCQIAAVVGAKLGIPYYTSSIDDALMLVPNGFVWKIMTDYGGLNRATVSDIPRLIVSADGATPALALCIAALKARQS